MSKIDYVAGSLKETTKQTLPQGMKKAERERVKATVSLRELEDEVTNDGRTEKVPTAYLQVEAEMPTYSLCLLRRLQPEESLKDGDELACVTDNDLCIEVSATELQHVLSSMGSQEVTMELLKDGRIEVRNSRATLTVQGTRVEATDAPGRIEDGIVLRDYTSLYTALKAAVEIAKNDNNENTQKCLHLHLTPDALIVESACHDTLCAYEARDIYDQAPTEAVDVVLSLSTAQALLFLFQTEECSEVRIQQTQQQPPRPPMGGDNKDESSRVSDGVSNSVSTGVVSPLGGQGGLGLCGLIFQSGYFTLVADAQDVVCRDYCEERDYTFQQTFPVERKQMLSALRTLKEMGETEVDITLGYTEVTLTGPAEVVGKTSVKVPILEGKNPQGIAGGYECAVGRFAIQPFITALSTCYTETEARIGHDDKGQKLAIDCGCLRIMQAVL